MVTTIHLLETTPHPKLAQKIARAVLFFAVIIAMTTVLLMTFSQMQPYHRLFAIISYFLGALFTVEYILRILNALRRGRRALKHYAVSFLGIIDFVSILPFTLPYLFGVDLEIVFIINFSRVLLIFKLTRYSQAFNTLGEVLSSVKAQLLLSIFIPIIFIVFSALLVYYVEHQAQPEAFRSVADGLWWAVITMTTTGYGDIYPITPLGQLFGGLTALIGVFIIALPTGIVSSAFVNKLNRDKNNKDTKLNMGSRDPSNYNQMMLHASMRNKQRMIKPTFNHKIGQNNN